MAVKLYRSINESVMQGSGRIQVVGKTSDDTCRGVTRHKMGRNGVDELSEGM
jgi:hypothetical protein